MQLKKQSKVGVLFVEELKVSSEVQALMDKIVGFSNKKGVYATNNIKK